MGAIHGLVPYYIFLIARIAFPIAGWRGTAFSGALALTSCLGAGNQSEIGTSFADNTTTIPILFGLWMVAKSHSGGNSRTRAWFLCGLSCGFAGGLKLTALPFLIGAVASASVGNGISANSIRYAFAVATGGALGWLTSHGYWSWYLWHEFQNPVFPFYNHLFRSPLVENFHFQYKNAATSLWDGIQLPIQILQHPQRVSELVFRDFRLAAGLLCSLGFLAKALLRPAPRPFPHSLALTLSVFFLTAYAAWVSVFAVYRFAIPLEILGPILLAAALAHLRQQLAGPLIATSMAILLLTTKPLDWGRISWAAPPETRGHVVPRLPDIANGSILIATYEPVAHIALRLPRSTRLVRITSHLLHHPTSHLLSTLPERLSDSKGPMYLLYSSTESRPGLAIRGLDLYVPRLPHHYYRLSDCQPWPGIGAPQSSHSLQVCRMNPTPPRAFGNYTDDLASL